MSRQVKLKDTGEVSTSDVAYKGLDGKYYSSQKAFEKCIKNKEYRKKCIDLMYSVLGYNERMIIPTFYYKELKKYEGIGYEALYRTMLSQNNSVQWALKNKSFNAETSKVMYIMAIYNNNIMDEYKKMVAEERAMKNLETVYDCNDGISETITRKQETKNIKRFLEE